MAVALRDIADIALGKLFGTEAAVRAEQRDADVACDDVLPFVRGRVPVQRAQRAGIEIEHHAGDRLGDRKAAGINPPLAATLKGRQRRLRQHPVFVRLGRRFYALQWHALHRRRNLAARKIHFLLRERIESGFRQAKILRQQRPGRVPDPVGDGERAELGEIAIVEDQDEVTRLVAQALQHVAVAARKIPDVAGIEIVGLGCALRIDHRGAHASLQHEGPFRGGGVPVQFAHRAGLELHGDAGNALGDRQLGDGRFLAKAVADHLALALLQREFEGRQLLVRERGIGDVVHEARIAGGGLVGAGQRRQRGDGGGSGQKLATMRIGHVALLNGRLLHPTLYQLAQPATTHRIASFRLRAILSIAVRATLTHHCFVASLLAMTVRGTTAVWRTERCKFNTTGKSPIPVFVRRVKP